MGCGTPWTASQGTHTDRERERKEHVNGSKVELVQNARGEALFTELFMMDESIHSCAGRFVR